MLHFLFFIKERKEKQIKAQKKNEEHNEKLKTLRYFTEASLYTTEKWNQKRLNIELESLSVFSPSLLLFWKREKGVLSWACPESGSLKLKEKTVSCEGWVPDTPNMERMLRPWFSPSLQSMDWKLKKDPLGCSWELGKETPWVHVSGLTPAGFTLLSGGDLRCEAVSVKQKTKWVECLQCDRASMKWP